MHSSYVKLQPLENTQIAEEDVADLTPYGVVGVCSEVIDEVAHNDPGQFIPNSLREHSHEVSRFKSSKWVAKFC